MVQWNLFLHSRPVNVFWMVKITQTLLVGQNEAIIQALQHWNTIIILSPRPMQNQVFSQLHLIQNGQIMSRVFQTCKCLPTQCFVFRFLGMNIQYSLIFSVYEVTHIIVNVELGVLLWQQYLNFQSLKTEIFQALRTLV